MATYSNSITLVAVEDGASGITYYTWIRYSNGAQTNPTVTSQPQSDTKQIGFAYNQLTNNPTSNYSDYTWSDYIGADGQNGVGVSNIVEQYYLSTSNLETTGGSWSNTPQEWVDGKYYWTRSEITWTNNTITHTTPILAQGLNSANSTAYSATTDLAAYMQTTDAELQNLQNQIDKSIETWYFSGVPGPSVAPENEWVPTAQQEDTRSEHVGDLYYDESTGYAYRYLYDETATPQYSWVLIRDEAVTEALHLAGEKKRIFIAQPVPPYDVGDLWVNGSTVKYCQTARTEGQSYNAADWTLTATDDTWAQQNAIVQVDVYYAKNTSSTTAPSGYDDPAASANWDTDPPQWTDGDFIWSVTVTTKNGTTSVTDPVCITGAKGASAPYIVLSGPTNVVTVNNNTSPATISPSGNIDIVATTSTNISSITWSYKVNGSTSSTTPSYISNITNGKRVNATTFANTSNVNTLTIIASGGGVNDAYTLTKLVNGQNGTNGTSSYTYIRYADDDQGTNISPTVLTTSKYVAIQITNSSTAPSSGWVWQKFVGDNGTSATQYYTHVRYSENANGSNYVDTPTSSTKYVGICVTTSSTPPAYNNSAWKWSKYVGADGQNGADAIEIILSNESHTLTAAADGTISSYSGASTTVYIYEGITDKSSDYTVTRSNPSGVSSTISGKTITVTSVTNGVGGVITITVKKGTTTIGTKQFSISVSKTGATGATGATGNGISSITVTYGTSSSGTDPTTVTQWSSTVPAVTQGNYLWTKTVVNYTNGSSSDPSYSAVYHSEDGKAPIYDIELSNEKIYKSAHDENTIEFKPKETFFFEVFKTEEGRRESFENFSYDLGILGGDSLKNLLTANQFNTLFSKSSNRVTFKLENFLNTSFGSGQETAASFQQALKRDNIYLLVTVWPSSMDLNNYVVDTGSGFQENVTYYEYINNKYVRTGDQERSASKTYYVVSSSNLLAKAVISVEFVSDMQLSITDTMIQASISSGKMEYTVNGLTIYNGGLRIVERIEQQDGENINKELFSYNEETHSLAIEGTGSFSGDIEARKIIAQSGSIGGFIIGENELYSSDGENESADNASVRLNGKNGFIYANNITLGENAVINGTLKAGKDGTTDNYYTQLSSDGTLILGDLELIGNGSKIQAKNGSFVITPEYAQFNDIIARGKITTAVFVKNNVQTVGGNMIFKPSYKIHHIENNKIYIDSSEVTRNGLNGDYIYLVAENGSLIGAPDLFKIAEGDGSTQIQDEFAILTLVSGQTVPTDLNNYPFSLIDLGRNEDIIIGINSDEAVSDFLYGRGMTISQMNIENSQASFDLKVFLGDLQRANLGSGYGLYSTNVYLTGSLITRTVSSGNSFYAGVNTLNGISADENLVGDSSEIIFWAGSANNSDEGIRNAPFQVTREGAIYAQKGKFEGAIISKSTIEGASIVGADIYTAAIHGTSTDDPCLKIYGTSGKYNVSGAIGFFRENYTEFTGDSFVQGTTYYEHDLINNYYFVTSDESKQTEKSYYTKTETQTFTIRQDGFYYIDDNFIVLSANEKQAIFDDYYTSGLHLNGNKISYRYNENYSLDFSNSIVKLKYSDDNYITLGEESILLNNTTTTVSNIFTLQNKLQYKPKYDNGSLIGYDLFIN